MNLESTISDVIARVFIWILLFIFSIIVENKFGITKWLKRKYHFFKNSEVHVMINVVFNSTLPLIDLKEYLKDSFRERYKRLKIYKDSSQSLDIMVDEIFHIYSSENPNNEVSIQTNKIGFKMQSIKKGLNKILDSINDAKERVNNEKGNGTTFTEKEFSLYLYLPYTDPFTKIYVPKNIQIKDYEIKLFHEEYGSVIKLKADFLNINTKYRHELEELIRYFI
jgi:hypothetical protein